MYTELFNLLSDLDSKDLFLFKDAKKNGFRIDKYNGIIICNYREKWYDVYMKTIKGITSILCSNGLNDLRKFSDIYFADHPDKKYGITIAHVVDFLIEKREEEINNSL